MAVEVLTIDTAGSRRCCCSCCSVRTGTILISILWIILGISNSLTCLSQLILLTNDERYDPEQVVKFRIRTEGEYKNFLKEFYTNHRTLSTVLTALILIGELINIPLSVLCLHGAIKRGPSIKLRAWIWFNILCAVLSATFAIMGAVYIADKYGGAGMSFRFELGLLILFVVTFGGYTYLIGVVYDYMREIRQFEDGAVAVGGMTVSRKIYQNRGGHGGEGENDNAEFHQVIQMY